MATRSIGPGAVVAAKVSGVRQWPDMISGHQPLPELQVRFPDSIQFRWSRGSSKSSRPSHLPLNNSFRFYFLLSTLFRLPRRPSGSA